MHDSSNSVVHILIVDDCAPWRSQIRSILRNRPEWNIVGEASDGKEAVEKATEMQPDVILLDIGMPHLNGIEAGRIIRQRCAKSKILFITQDGDSEVRNAALEIGVGYIVKTDAHSELLNAIFTALSR